MDKLRSDISLHRLSKQGGRKEGTATKTPDWDITCISSVEEVIHEFFLKLLTKADSYLSNVYRVQNVERMLV